MGGQKLKDTNINDVLLNNKEGSFFFEWKKLLDSYV